MDIDNIYQKAIIDYSKDKKNQYDMIDATHVERAHNPNCGDDISLLVKLKDGLIENVSYLGQGCAISIASTNILINIVKGKSIEEAKIILEKFFNMMRNENHNLKNNEILEDANILHFTYNMPARIKCATLSWHAMKIIIEKDKG